MNINISTFTVVNLGLSANSNHGNNHDSFSILPIGNSNRTQSRCAGINNTTGIHTFSAIIGMNSMFPTGPIITSNSSELLPRDFHNIATAGADVRKLAIRNNHLRTVDRPISDGVHSGFTAFCTNPIGSP